MRAPTTAVVTLLLFAAVVTVVLGGPAVQQASADHASCSADRPDAPSGFSASNELAGSFFMVDRSGVGTSLEDPYELHWDLKCVDGHVDRRAQLVVVLVGEEQNYTVAGREEAITTFDGAEGKIRISTSRIETGEYQVYLSENSASQGRQYVAGPETIQVENGTAPAGGPIPVAAPVNSGDPVAWANFFGVPTQLFTNPEGFVIDIIRKFFINQFILPVASTVFGIVVTIVDLFVTLFVGTDDVVGPIDGTFPGVLDIPFIVTGPFVSLIAFVANSIISTLAGFNASLAAFASGFGLASPAVVTAAWVVEVMLFGWAAWIVVNSIDVPLIRPVELLSSLTWPFRRAIDFFT